MYVWINRYIHKQGRVYIVCGTVTTPPPVHGAQMCVDTCVGHGEWGGRGIDNKRVHLNLRNK